MFLCWPIAIKLKPGFILATIFVILFCNVTITSSLLAQELAPLPKITARVTDTTGLLSSREKIQLERLLQNFETSKGSQIVVVIIPTVKPEDIASYSFRLAESRKIGRKNIDDGAILLIAKNDKKLRIEVGYGLEGSLTDIICHRIIQDIISPAFRQGNFYGGIHSGLTTIMKVIDGEDLPKPIRNNRRGRIGGASFFLIAIILVFVSIVLRSLLGSGPAFAVNIILGSVLGYFFLSWFMGAALAFILSMFSGAGRAGYIGSGMGMMGMGMGGYMGGGFGGGGGGFGGGGASGGW